MPGAPVGATVNLTYDWHPSDPAEEPPGALDALLAYGARGRGSAYMIEHARQARSDQYPSRYKLRCVKLSGEASLPPGVRIFPIYWYRRDRRRLR